MHFAHIPNPLPDLALNSVTKYDGVIHVKSGCFGRNGTLVVYKVTVQCFCDRGNPTPSDYLNEMPKLFSMKYPTEETLEAYCQKIRRPAKNDRVGKSPIDRNNTARSSQCL